MGINQNEKAPPGQRENLPVETAPPGYAWVRVLNLHDTSLILPGGYYRDPIPSGNVATFAVRHYEDFAADLQILRLVTQGHIEIEPGEQPVQQSTATPAQQSTATPAQPLSPNPGSPNAWEREPPTDRVWHGKWSPRNPQEQQLKQIQDQLDAAAAKKE